jgi:type I restriction enzyme S subunit
LPYFDIDTQIEIKNLFVNSEEIKSSLTTELNQQVGLVKKLRQQLLQDAVQGKLVEQNKKDEPASELLKKIKAEKEKLIAEKKLKKEKEKLIVNQEDVPFELPKNWSWCNLGELAILNARIGWKGLNASEYKKEGPLFLSVHSLNYGDYVDYSQAFHISQERYDESPEIMLKDNDILICKDGAGIGKLGIIKDLKEQATTNSSLLVIRCFNNLNVKFIYYSYQWAFPKYCASKNYGSNNSSSLPKGFGAFLRCITTIGCTKPNRSKS